METEKGVCFSCDNKKPILNHCTERIQQIFVYLYTETVLNVNKLQSILPELKLCPVCHHKLIVLEQIYMHIEANRNQTDEDVNCALCKKGDFIFKISKNYFKEMSDDFPIFSDKHKYDICSQCCFYLDCRYYLKMRLFSQYPQLRIVPKLKLKFGSEITSHSTPLVTQKRERLQHRKRSSSSVILIESDSEMPPQETPKGLDLSSIKSFKVLRNNRLISKSKKICRDSKLLNQILYVKLSRKQSASDNENLSSENTEAQKDLTMLTKSTSKKSSMRREKNKKSDKILDSEKKSSMEENESNLKNSASKLEIDTSESVPISEEDSHETSDDCVNTNKQTYRRIILNKQTKITKKPVIEEHVEKNNIITDNFKKSLVVSLERRARLCGTSNLHIEKPENEDLSIEETESEERSQTVMDNSRMDVDSTDNSKLDKHCSLESAEGKDSETINSEKQQLEHDHETASQESESKLISEGSKKLDSEDRTDESHKNGKEEESNGNTVCKSQCDKSQPEIDEHEERGNSDEQPSKDDEENVHISDKIIEEDKEGSLNEDESCNKSNDTIEDAVSKTKEDIEPEKTDKKTEDTECPGNQEETDEKTNEDGKKETDEDNTNESGDENETGDKEETVDKKEINNKNKSEDKEESGDEKETSVSNEKSEEIGIDEEDRNNIDMTEPSELTKEDAQDAEIGAADNSKDVSNADQDNDVVTGCKRKRSDSPDVSSPEKKKKKVTFSEEVLESSE